MEGETKMATDGSSRRGLLTAGGILSIVGGASEATGAVIMVCLTIVLREVLRRASPYPYPGIIWPISAGVFIFALGIVAIIGGVSAMRGKKFSLSLVGAICCALPSVINGIMNLFGLSLAGFVWVLAGLILGIPAIIFICLSKREFRAKGKGNGI
jgi:hypothetical protein